MNFSFSNEQIELRGGAKKALEGGQTLGELGLFDLGPIELIGIAEEIGWAGAEGNQIEDAMGTALLAVSGQLLGVSDRLIAMTVDYAKQRLQFGKPIGSFQAVKHHLANAQTRLEFSRPVVYRAAWSYSIEHTDHLRHVAMAKAVACETGVLSARVALQIHGAIGYTKECPIHPWLTKAWVLSSRHGDAPFHRSKVLEALCERG